MLVEHSRLQSYILPAVLLGVIPAVVILIVGLIAAPVAWPWVLALALVTLFALGSSPWVLRLSYSMSAGIGYEAAPLVLFEMLVFIPVAVLLAGRIPPVTAVLMAMLGASVPLALLGALGLSYVLYLLITSITVSMLEASLKIDYVETVNEGEFETHLTSFWEASVRYGDPLSFAIIGLAPGKANVQTEGVSVELRELQQKVRSAIRKSDISGPHRRDAVWVILARTGGADAKTALSRVVDVVAASQVLRERQIKSAVRSYSSGEQDLHAAIAALKEEYEQSAPGVI